MKPLRSRISALVFLAVLAGLVSGCVFINTFYNASVSYDRARRAHTELVKTNPDTIFASLPGPIITDYDTAISKSRKVLNVYHTKKKWHDNAYFTIGRSLYYKGDYSGAIRTFKQLEELFATSLFIPEANLFTARSWMALDEYDRAEEICQFIISRYSDLDKKKEVTLLLAEIARMRDGKAVSIDLLQKALLIQNDPFQKLLLSLKIADLYISLSRYDRAMTVLRSAPRRAEVPAILYRLDRSTLKCMIELDSLNGSIAYVNGMLKDKRYGRYTAEMLLAKSEALIRLGKKEEAIQLYETIISRYETSSSFGDAAFRLGEIEQKSKGNRLRAKELYTKALSRIANDSLKLVIQDRLAALSLLDQLAKSDTTRRADTLRADNFYRIGELFWLRLDQPDSALAWFTKIIRDTTLISDSLDKAYYAAGFISRAVLRDTARSDSFFASLYAKFPASEYAKAAQKASEIPITILTRPDSADRAFTNAENLLLNSADPKDAIAAYEAIAWSYKELPIAPKSLYVAAWVNDYILEKNKTAMELYQMLCDSFPATDWCTRRAQPRLTTAQDSLRVRAAARKALQSAALKQTASPVTVDSTKSKASLRDTTQTIDSNAIKTDTLKPAIDSSRVFRRSQFYRPPQNDSIPIKAPPVPPPAQEERP